MNKMATESYESYLDFVMSILTGSCIPEITVSRNLFEPIEVQEVYCVPSSSLELEEELEEDLESIEESERTERSERSSEVSERTEENSDYVVIENEVYEWYYVN